ncbi:hypothetical protein J6P92_01165 [bacterium]|nr:hypothetical protein [bacterium]
MRRNARVIQISGLRGILLGLFVAVCLIAGFVGFPAFAAMHIWNFTAQYIAIPTIGFLQGLLLWAIVALIVFLINDRKRFLTAFSIPSKMPDEEMQRIMDNIRMQTNAQIINSMIMKSQELNRNIEEKQEKKDEENV